MSHKPSYLLAVLSSSGGKWKWRKSIPQKPSFYCFSKSTLVILSFPLIKGFCLDNIFSATSNRKKGKLFHNVSRPSIDELRNSNKCVKISDSLLASSFVECRGRWVVCPSAIAHLSRWKVNLLCVHFQELDSLRRFHSLRVSLQAHPRVSISFILFKASALASLGPFYCPTGSVVRWSKCRISSKTNNLVYMLCAHKRPHAERKIEEEMCQQRSWEEQKHCCILKWDLKAWEKGKQIIAEAEDYRHR